MNILRPYRAFCKITQGALLANPIFTALKKIPFDFEEEDFKGSNFT